MVPFELQLPVINLAIPKTSWCITVDASTLEASVAVLVLGIIVVAGNLGLLSSTEFYASFSLMLGYLSTKFFGMSNRSG